VCKFLGLKNEVAFGARTTQITHGRAQHASVFKIYFSGRCKPVLARPRIAGSGVVHQVHELDLAAVLAKRGKHTLLAGVLVAFLGDDVAGHAAAVRPELVVGAPEFQLVLFLGQLDVEGQLGLCVQSLVFLSFALVVIGRGHGRERWLGHACG